MQQSADSNDRFFRQSRNDNLNSQQDKKMDAGYQSTLRPSTFEGKGVVVTGGGSGIGRCVAHELASLGARVFLLGRTKEKLEEVAAEIVADGGHARPIVCDIRDEVQVKDAVSKIIMENGRIDGLVNNAGGQFPGLLEGLSLNAFDAVVRNNLHGTFLMMREVFNQSMREHGGAMVNMSIAMWEAGLPGMGHSGAGRAGVDNITKTAAVEWARSGVRVNAVAPGWIVSSGLNSYKGTSVQAMMPNVERSIPAQRMGTESEVSAMICFLLSPAAAYVTGMNIRIDGGSALTSPFFPLMQHDNSQPFSGFHRSEAPSVLNL